MKINLVNNILNIKKPLKAVAVTTALAIGGEDVFESSTYLKNQFDSEGRKVADIIYSKKTDNPILQHNYDPDGNLIEILKFDVYQKGKITECTICEGTERIQNHIFEN